MSTTKKYEHLTEPRYRLYDKQGTEVTVKKGNDNTYIVWFGKMNRNEEGLIWTGSLDELVYEEELEVLYQ